MVSYTAVSERPLRERNESCVHVRKRNICAKLASELGPGTARRERNESCVHVRKRNICAELASELGPGTARKPGQVVSRSTSLTGKVELMGMISPAAARIRLRTANSHSSSIGWWMVVSGMMQFLAKEVSS